MHRPEVLSLVDFAGRRWLSSVPSSHPRLQYCIPCRSVVARFARSSFILPCSDGPACASSIEAGAVRPGAPQSCLLNDWWPRRPSRLSSRPQGSTKSPPCVRLIAHWADTARFTSFQSFPCCIESACSIACTLRHPQSLRHFTKRRRRSRQIPVRP